VTVAEARERFDDLLAPARGGRGRRVVIERDGEPVAAVISFRDLERFDLMLRRRQRNWESLERIRRAFDDVPDAELEREIDKAVAEARAELSAQRQQERVVRQ
jgi:PHD/YefM family antitoxin component YafN of YafNO toxin-antitoxin module